MRRWPSGLGLLIAALVVSGCQSPVDQLNAFIRTKTRKVTPVTQVQTDLGPLTVYRVTSWHQCGAGYTLATGGGAETVSSCDQRFPLTRFDMIARNHVMRMGTIEDPRIKQVILIYDDERRVPAQMAGGVWYFFQPGNEASDPYVEGLDESGNTVKPRGR